MKNEKVKALELLITKADIVSSTVYLMLSKNEQERPDFDQVFHDKVFLALKELVAIAENIEAKSYLKRSFFVDVANKNNELQEAFIKVFGLKEVK